jgi:ribonuclease P protein component
MLPKRSRLTALEVRTVLAKGAPKRVGTFSGRYLPGRTPLGLAVIVSKRDAKTAVTRNRLRRAAYKTLATLPLPTEGSLALFVRPAAK